MSRLADPILDEVFTLRPAWETLTGRVAKGVAWHLVDPADVASALDGLSVEGWFRLTHLMVANSHADTLDEAVDVLADLRAFAMQGKRPRIGAEAGLSLKGGARCPTISVL